MDDEQLLRCSRHILLPEIGVEGQQRLLHARALVVGAGGLGSPAALYLAAAGIGTIALCDDDVVDPSNLQRQILHLSSSTGRPKVVSAGEMLARIAPGVHVLAIQERLQGERLEAQVEAADVVLDCSDNFPTRHALNRACVRFGKPLVSGTAIRFEGQVAVFDLRDATAPCYACLFPEDVPFEEERCALMGVFAPLTGVIGTMQAAEALKIVACCGESLAGRMLLFDALAAQWREVFLARNPGCSACGRRHRRRKT